MLIKDQDGLYARRMVRHANKGAQIISAVSDYTSDRAKLPLEACFRRAQSVACLL